MTCPDSQNAFSQDAFSQDAFSQDALNGMRAVILAGGLGTRLRSVVPDLPKPMAPIGGRPFLEILLARLQAAGCRDIVLCVGYKAERIEEHFGDGARFGVHLRYSREAELRGTAGALVAALPLISGDAALPILAMNGDCFCEVNFAAFVEAHGARGAKATLAAPFVPERARYGSLALDADHAVLDFIEKGDATGAGPINGGVYLLSRALLESLPHDCICSLEREVFPPLCANGLFAFPIHGVFIDIGIPSELERAQTVLAPYVRRA